MYLFPDVNNQLTSREFMKQKKNNNTSVVIISMSYLYYNGYTLRLNYFFFSIPVSLGGSLIKLASCGRKKVRGRWEKWVWGCSGGVGGARDPSGRFWPWDKQQH